MEVLLIGLFLVMALAFANGTNDVSKAVATLVGSGITNYRTAILWGTVWTMLGAVAAGVLAKAMINTFSRGLIDPSATLPATLAISVLAGATGWVLLASRTGLPVSTTHALVGAIIGAGLTAIGSQGLIWPGIMKKIALPLLVSPFLALTLSVIIHPIVRYVADRWEGTCLCLLPASRALVSIDVQGSTHTLFQATIPGGPAISVPAHCDRAGLRGMVFGLHSIHWLSSGLASFARGTNDAPKIVAILLLGDALIAWSPATMSLAFAGVALAMGLGSFLGGFRVTEVLAEKVTRMDHAGGLTANLATSSIVLVAATVGLPVSTTHVSSSAIVGIGLLKGLRSVRWTTVRDMVLAWVITLPAAAGLACLTFLCLERGF